MPNFSQPRAQLGFECVKLLRHRIEDINECASDTTLIAIVNLLVAEVCVLENYDSRN